MHLRRRRDEEGQVTPALLIAVIGGFAIAVAFVSLQNLLDQTGRATTASDAAALAAADAHAEEIDRLLSLPGLHLGWIKQMVHGQQMPSLNGMPETAAADYAAANGAEVVETSGPHWEPSMLPRWEYTVTTKQLDEVEGGSSTARTESVTKVSVEMEGVVCPGLGGLVVDGNCGASFEVLEQLCEFENNPPEDDADDEGKDDGAGAGGGDEDPPEPPEEEEPPSDPWEDLPAWLHGVGCLTSDQLGTPIWKVRLINVD